MEKEQWDRRMLVEIGIIKGCISNIKIHLEKRQNEHLISNELYKAYIILSKNTEGDIAKILQLMFRP